MSLREGLEWTVFDTPVALEEVTAPTIVEDNTLKIYAKDQSGISALFYKGDDEVEVNLSGGLTGTGTANRLAYWTGTTVLAANAVLTNTRILFANSNGLPTDNANLIYDPTIAAGLGSFVLQGEGASNNARFEIKTFGSGTSPVFQGVGANGTIASPTASSVDLILAALGGFGYDNTPARASGAKAFIGLKAGEAWTTTAQGTYLTFETTPLLSTTRAERFRVGPSGQFGIGGATYGTVGNLFQSGGASAAPTWLDHTTDFLSQYALLAGRAGGQTLAGGNAANEDFILKGTTHPTKTTSYVLLQPDGGNVGIGTTTPTVQFESRSGGNRATILGPALASYLGTGSVFAFLASHIIGTLNPIDFDNEVALQVIGQTNDVTQNLIAGVYAIGSATHLSGNKGRIVGFAGEANTLDSSTTTGTVDEMFGIYGQVGNDGAYVVDIGAGLYIERGFGGAFGGSITDLYGILVKNQAGVGTNSWNIYSEGPGQNQFVGNTILGGGVTAAELRFLEPSGSGSNYTAFKAQAQAGNVTYTLPAVDAAASGYGLLSDAAGALSWGQFDSGNFTGTNWTDLTDGGATTLHSHAGGSAETAHPFLLMGA